jgi:hypothetical protein
MRDVSDKEKSIVWKVMKTFYKFKSIEHIEYAADIIINERLYCADFEKLNDPFEGLFFAIIRQGAFSSGFSNGFDNQIKECKKILGPSKICSLSKELHDVRMWSFYANDHKGIAIEIDFTDFEGDIKEVHYSETLPEYLATHVPVEILTKKTSHWSYESEYRIIWENEFYSIKGRIKAIYLGQRILDVHLKILKNIVPSAIPMYTTRLDTTEIKIKPDKLFVR